MCTIVERQWHIWEPWLVLFLFANDNVKYLTVGGMSGLKKFFSFLDEITGLLGHFWLERSEGTRNDRWGHMSHHRHTWSFKLRSEFFDKSSFFVLFHLFVFFHVRYLLSLWSTGRTPSDSVAVIRRRWPTNGGAIRDWWRDREDRRPYRHRSAMRPAKGFRTCWPIRRRPRRIRPRRPCCSFRREISGHRRRPRLSTCPWIGGGRSWRNCRPSSAPDPIVWLSSLASPSKAFSFPKNTIDCQVLFEFCDTQFSQTV